MKSSGLEDLLRSPIDVRYVGLYCIARIAVAPKPLTAVNVARNYHMVAMAATSKTRRRAHLVCIHFTSRQALTFCAGPNFAA